MELVYRSIQMPPGAHARERTGEGRAKREQMSGERVMDGLGA